MWSSIASVVSGSDVTMTPAELEGVLVSAEAGLLNSLLLLTEESLMAFVKVMDYVSCLVLPCCDGDFVVGSWNDSVVFVVSITHAYAV